jgi:hypothetical protein
MKEMNLLEAQLRSWQPRRPSAGLKRRLFASPISRVPQMAWFVGWLVPATACVLLTFMMFNSGNAIPGRSFRHNPMVATMLSNQGFLMPAPENSCKGQNEVSSVTFDWTNHSGSTSSMPSFPQNRMN